MMNGQDVTRQVITGLVSMCKEIGEKACVTVFHWGPRDEIDEWLIDCTEFTPAVKHWLTSQPPDVDLIHNWVTDALRSGGYVLAKVQVLTGVRYGCDESFHTVTEIRLPMIIEG